METIYLAKDSPTSIQFQTIKNGQKFDYIDIQCLEQQNNEQRLFINHFRVRFFSGNNQSELVNYNSINGWSLIKLLTTIFNDVQTFSKKHSSYETCHNLSSLVKNEVEDVWYLCWK